jgi:phage baseplate assembly protein W
MAIRRAFAQEDSKGLQSSSISSSRSRQYNDIDLTLAIKPTSGEVYKKSNGGAVKQAIKTLILTNLLEKPFRADFGADLRSQLFDLADRGGSAVLRRNITETIEIYEPRAEVLAVNVNLQPDRNSLDVTLKFKVVNTEEETTFTTTLARLR